MSGIRIAKTIFPLPVRNWLNHACRDPINDALDKWRLQRAARQGEELKVEIGKARAAPLEGWFRTNINTLNLWNDQDWERLFQKEERVNALLAEHVLEHIAPKLLVRALHNCYRYLRPGGRLRISVPDGNNPDRTYIESVEPGGSGPAADDHRVLFSIGSLTACLEEAGFVVHAIEYYDAEGRFHTCEYDTTYGRISRAGRPLPFRSLNVDAIKPGG